MDTFYLRADFLSDCLCIQLYRSYADGQEAMESYTYIPLKELKEKLDAIT